MENALAQLRAHATIAQAQIFSTSPDSKPLLRQLNYDDLVSFAHEVGNKLVGADNPRDRYRLRKLYQEIADIHHAWLGR